MPLVDAGLDLTGLDVSRAALQALAERAPELENQLVHGDPSVPSAWRRLQGDPGTLVGGSQAITRSRHRPCGDHILGRRSDEDSYGS